MYKDENNNLNITLGYTHRFETIVIVIFEQ